MGNVKMKYDDCPYNCNEGQIMDYKLKRLVPCPHCSEKRKELAKSGLAESEDGDIMPLASILGIENKYLSVSFSYDAVIPDSEQLFLDEESIRRQKEEIDEIYLGLSVGQLPNKSYCIGLGNKGRVETVVYPILAKAYLSNLSVGKFMSCSEYNRMCIDMDKNVEGLYKADLVLMLINDGSSKADIASAKGLMQIRALRGKPTIFISTWSVEACSILLACYDEESYFMAHALFVRYKISKNSKPQSKYINNLTGVENGVFSEESSETENRGKSYTSMGDLLNI